MLIPEPWNSQVQWRAEIKETILNCLDAALDSPDTDNRLEVLSQLLSELRNCNDPDSEFYDSSERDLTERPGFLFPWSTPAHFFKDVINLSLGKIIKLAIDDADTASQHTAEQFLKQLGQDGE